MGRSTYQPLDSSQVFHAYETGGRLGRLDACLRVSKRKRPTVYVIRSAKAVRSHPVPYDMLDPDFDGYLAVDWLKTNDILEVAEGL